MTSSSSPTALSTSSHSSHSSPFTLNELHQLPLPSQSTAFNALRICRSSPTSSFVKLSTLKSRSLEVVKGRRTPFKIVEEDKRSYLAEGDVRTEEDGSEDEDEEELTVSSDVISGDGENWDNWYQGGGAVEAIAVRKQRKVKINDADRDKNKDGAIGVKDEGTQGYESVFLLCILRKGTVDEPTSSSSASSSLKKRQTKSNSKQSQPPPSSATATPNSQQVLELTYAPLVLHLTYLPRAQIKTLSLLISSNDTNTIKLYQPIANNFGKFEEVTDSNLKEKVLPGVFSGGFGSSIVTIDSTLTFDGGNKTYSYYIAVGCKNGNIQVTSYNPLKTNETLKTRSFFIDGPIGCVQLFVRKVLVAGEVKDGTVDLLVGSLDGYACIYKCELYKKRDTTGDSIVPASANNDESSECDFFTEPTLFKGAGLLGGGVGVEDDDHVLCIYEAGFTCLGGYCVFVGTYKGKVLIFEESPSTTSSKNNSLKTTYLLQKTIQLQNPVHKFAIGDINNDGIPEIVVLTKFSVHFFQRCADEIAGVGLMRALARRAAVDVRVEEVLEGKNG